LNSARSAVPPTIRANDETGSIQCAALIRKASLFPEREASSRSMEALLVRGKQV
jgi:hypothetical protein